MRGQGRFCKQSCWVNSWANNNTGQEEPQPYLTRVLKIRCRARALPQCLLDGATLIARDRNRSTGPEDSCWDTSSWDCQRRPLCSGCSCGSSPAPVPPAENNGVGKKLEMDLP